MRLTFININYFVMLNKNITFAMSKEIRLITNKDLNYEKYFIYCIYFG